MWYELSLWRGRALNELKSMRWANNPQFPDPCLLLSIEKFQWLNAYANEQLICIKFKSFLPLAFQQIRPHGASFEEEVGHVTAQSGAVGRRRRRRRCGRRRMAARRWTGSGRRSGSVGRQTVGPIPQSAADDSGRRNDGAGSGHQVGGRVLDDRLGAARRRHRTRRHDRSAAHRRLFLLLPAAVRRVGIASAATRRHPVQVLAQVAASAQTSARLICIKRRYFNRLQFNQTICITNEPHLHKNDIVIEILKKFFEKFAWKMRLICIFVKKIGQLMRPHLHEFAYSIDWVRGQSATCWTIFVKNFQPSVENMWIMQMSCGNNLNKTAGIEAIFFLFENLKKMLCKLVGG